MCASLSRSVGRGSGDTLSRRLASVRADIVARGKPSFTISGFSGRREFRYCVPSAASIPRIFDRLRKHGVSIVRVIEHRTLCGCRVSLGTGVEWLLLSRPVLISGNRYERSESAERCQRLGVLHV